jgi:hypothetical protein
MKRFSGGTTVAITTILLGSSSALAAGNPTAGKSLLHRTALSATR